MSEERFKKAEYMIRNGPPRETSDAEKLKVYALYKQATIGDINIPQPWSVQFEARAKWDAWNEQKGKSKEAAMAEYCELLDAGMFPVNSPTQRLV